MAYRTLLDLNHNFSSCRIFVYDSWLAECCEYLMRNNNYTTVFEQWLLNDLTVTSPGCLPRDPNTNSNDIYALQINCIWSLKSLPDSVADIFIELNKMVKPEMRADEHILKNRGLLLILTDGVQNLFGCVLKPMKNLFINTVPGCKMVVKGPLVYSNFLDSTLIIFLSEDNCELLGGEVGNRMKESYKHTKYQLHSQRQDVDVPEVYTSISNFTLRISEGGVARNKKRYNYNLSMPVNKRKKSEPAGNNNDAQSSNQILEQIVISDDEEFTMNEEE